MQYLVRRESSSVTVLELEGELTGPWATQELGMAIEEAVRLGKGELILDMAKTESINSSCLGRLFLAKKELLAQGIKLKIRKCSESVYNTLLLVRADLIIDIETPR